MLTVWMPRSCSYFIFKSVKELLHNWWYARIYILKQTLPRLCHFSTRFIQTIGTQMVKSYPSINLIHDIEKVLSWCKTILHWRKIIKICRVLINISITSIIFYLLSRKSKSMENKHMMYIGIYIIVLKNC